MKEKSKAGRKAKSAKVKKPASKVQSGKAGKLSAKNKSGEKSDIAGLKKELNKMSDRIGKDGLEFLIRQAQVLIYNKKVEESNARLEKGTRVTIEKPPFSDKAGMEIKEADDGSSFIFVINRERKFFTLEEMRKIVKLCSLAENEKEASLRLFTWFKNNRGDVLIDIGIESYNDPALTTIYNYIIKRYTVRKN